MNVLVEETVRCNIGDDDGEKEKKVDVCSGRMPVFLILSVAESGNIHCCKSFCRSSVKISCSST
jgi:hypothetical protein